MKNYWLKLLFAVISLSFFSMSFALPVFSPSQLAVIEKRGYIRVGIYSHTSSPFIIYSKDRKKITGIDIDIANSIGRLLGVKVVFDHSVKQYSDLFLRAYNKKDDIVLSGLVRTAKRARTIFMSNAYFRFQVGVLVNRVKFDKLTKPLAETFNQANITFGEIYGSAYAGYVKNLYPKAKIKYFYTDKQVFEAVQSGSVDATMIDQLVKNAWIKQKPERAIRTRYYLVPGYYSSYSIGASYSYPVLDKWLSTYTRTAIDIGYMNKLLNKYTREK